MIKQQVAEYKKIKAVTSARQMEAMEQQRLAQQKLDDAAKKVEQARQTLLRIQKEQKALTFRRKSCDKEEYAKVKVWTRPKATCGGSWMM